MENQISFNVSGNNLRGVLHIPDNNKKIGLPAVLLCHGFMGNKTGLHRLFVKAARFLALAGYVVLRFDFSGCGDSDGNHEDVTINGQITETLAALEYLRSQPFVKKDETYLIGLSMGAAVASLAAERADGLRGLALWAPVANMYKDIKGIVGDGLFGEIEANGQVDYLGFGLRSEFLQSLRVNQPLTAAGNFQNPALIIHGTGDDEIPCTNAGLYKKFRDESSRLTKVHYIPDADHTFSAQKWEHEVFSVTLDWLRKCSRLQYHYNPDYMNEAMLTG